MKAVKKQRIDYNKAVAFDCLPMEVLNLKRRFKSGKEDDKRLNQALTNEDILVILLKELSRSDKPHSTMIGRLILLNKQKDT